MQPKKRGHIEPGVTLGHVFYDTTDLQPMLEFYHGLLGFDVMAEEPGSVFLAAGGYHHHIAISTTQSNGKPAAAKGTTGVNHIALRFPTRAALAGCLRRLLEAGVRLQRPTDFGTQVAFYVEDPDGNLVELSWDRPEAEWPKGADGKLQFDDQPLSVECFLAIS